MFPSNEAETIALYKLCQRRFGWQITHLQVAFPDAVIENEQGKQLVAEFEFKSKNFRNHKHDPDGCDIIIAYEDNWENPPVPVWELQKYTEGEATEIHYLLSHYIPKKDLTGLNFQMGMLRSKIRRKDNEITRLNDLDNWFNKISSVSSDIACLVMACGFFFWGSYRLLEWLFGVL